MGKKTFVRQLIPVRNREGLKGVLMVMFLYVSPTLVGRIEGSRDGHVFFCPLLVCSLFY